VKFGHVVFTARRYASAVVYAVVVRLSVRLTQASTVPTLSNIGSRKLHQYDSPGTSRYISGTVQDKDIVTMEHY